MAKAYTLNNYNNHNMWSLTIIFSTAKQIKIAMRRTRSWVSLKCKQGDLIWIEFKWSTSQKIKWRTNAWICLSKRSISWDKWSIWDIREREMKCLITALMHLKKLSALNRKLMNKSWSIFLQNYSERLILE